MNVTIVLLIVCCFFLNKNIFIQLQAALNPLWKVKVHICVIFGVHKQTTLTEILVFAGYFRNFQIDFHKNVCVHWGFIHFTNFYSKNNDKFKVQEHYFIKRWRKNHWRREPKSSEPLFVITTCLYPVVPLSFQLAILLEIWQFDGIPIGFGPVASALIRYFFSTPFNPWKNASNR